MERKCSSCGARISDGMKICANCGKVVPSVRTTRRPSPYREVRNNDPGRSVQRASRNTPVRNQRPYEQAYKSDVGVMLGQEGRNQRASEQKKVTKPRSKAKAPRRKLIFKSFKTALILLIIYFVISVIQIYRVRFSTYNFNIDMKMSQKNYGQATDNYFDSGYWVYNPFTFKVKYSGEKLHGEDYELTFTAFSSIKLQSVIIDGKERESDKLESAIMGLFI